MKLPREIAAIAMVLGLAGGYVAPVCAQTQIVVVDPLSRQMPVEITGVVTRAQIPQVPAQFEGWQIQPTYGPAIFGCTGGRGQSRPYSITPDRLKEDLLRTVTGRTGTASIGELSALIQRIESESLPIQKLQWMFGTSTVPGPGGTARAFLGPLDSQNPFEDVSSDRWSQLRMGQEISLQGPLCLTTAQIDQTIAEGLRVMREVLRNLAGTTAGGAAPPRRGSR